MKKYAFFNKLIAAILFFIVFVAGIVFAFDPFYHYHSPWFGLKAVLTEPEYQVIGSIRNFNYDSIILGSSVAENFDNEWFENEFETKTIKGIKKSGTTAYLLYFLDEAFNAHQLKYVFYSLDTSALLADYSLDIEADGLPIYLFDNNPFNDVSYIFNKDVLFEKIPYMLGQSFSMDYKEGESFNWAKYKSFSKEIALSNYEEPEEQILSSDELDKYKLNINENLEQIEKRINEHPDTIFYIWIPPYSCLWQEEQTRLGKFDISMFAIDEACKRLEQYENVRFYSFIDEKDITDNLDNYMDPIHYSQDINYYIFSKLSR